MSGEPGAESEITELEDLQVQIDRLEDDLVGMTQRKDVLADALESALDQLSTIEGEIAYSDLNKVHYENS